MSAPRGPGRIAAENRRARFEYAIADTIEAGLVLRGTEVKSLRGGKANITDSYASEDGGELWLVNADIPEYGKAHEQLNHDRRRPRKLLLHKKQVNKLMGAIQREGMTVVPLKIYFNGDGRAKVEIALAKGKKLHDKRDTEKKRDWQRDKARLMREKG